LKKEKRTIERTSGPNRRGRAKEEKARMLIPIATARTALVFLMESTTGPQKSGAMADVRRARDVRSPI